LRLPSLDVSFSSTPSKQTKQLKNSQTANSSQRQGKDKDNDSFHA
jgi:hypothetical protein